MPGALALVSLALLAVPACGGKGTEGTCADGPACDGGSPVGTWNVAGNCKYSAIKADQPFNPAEAVSFPLPPILTASPVPATTSGDWCSQLIYTPSKKVLSVNLPHDAPALASGQVALNADGTFTAALNFTTYEIVHFTPYCMQAGGLNNTCTTLAQDLTDFYTANAGMDSTGAMYPDVAGIVCQAAPDSGCDCGYNYNVHLTDTGAWASAGSLMTQSTAPNAYSLNGKNATSQAPSSVMVSTICKQGPQLTLSGYNGQSLFHVPGLRVLSLTQ